MGNYITKIISLLILLAGFLNISSALFVYNPQRLAILETIIPQEVSNISRTFTLLTGIFLVYLANALWHRKKRAWTLSLLLLFSSFFSHLAKDIDIAEAAFLTIPFILLINFRKLYTVQSARIKISSSFRNTISILTFLLIYSFFGYFLFQNQFRQKVTPQAVVEDYLYIITGFGKDSLSPDTRIAAWFEDSLAVVGISSLILALGSIFAPFLEKEKPTEEEIANAKKLIFEYGQNPLSCFGLMDDKRYFLGKNNKCFVAYKIGSGAAIALGDPIGERKHLSMCLKEFEEQTKQRGLSLAFVACLESNRKIYEKAGYKFHKIGEDVVIPTQKYTLEGPENKTVRNAVSKLERDGVTYEWFSFDQIPWRVTRDFDNLHREWLSEKKGPRLTFAVDFYPPPVLPQGKMLAAYSPGKALLSALTFYPYRQGEGRVLDLMLRDKKAPNGIMEASIAQAVSHFREEGVDELNLGMTLLSNIKEEENTAIKAVDKLASMMKIFYDYESLYDFKKRFNPVWQSKYLAYKSVNDLPKISLALLSVNIKDKNVAKLLTTKYLKRQNIL